MPEAPRGRARLAVQRCSSSYRAGARPARGPPVLRRRPGRAAAAVDGRARDAAAWCRPRPAPTASAARSRRPTWSPTRSLAIPLGRLVDARGQGRVLALGSLVFGSAMVAARRHRAGRLAALDDVRRRGRGRRHPAADRRLRPHPLGPRPRPARRGGDRLRVRGGRRRVRLHRRADPRHPAGHPGRPGRRASRPPWWPAWAGAWRSPPSAAPSHRPILATGPPEPRVPLPWRTAGDR